MAVHGRGGADPTVEHFLEEREDFRQKATVALEVARSPDAQQSLRNSREFAVGDKVWLITKNLHKYGEPCRKLLYKFNGPFEITERVGKAAYRLNLPPAMSRLHPVFHVSLLAPQYPRPDGASADPKLFDAVPMQADAAAVDAVPEDLHFQQILRHRDKELQGTNVRDYLVVCREGNRTVDKWFPDVALPTALLAEYWSALSQRQLAGVQAGAPPAVPRPHQTPHSAGISGLDTLGVRRADALLLEGEESDDQ
jgi:hypothetical protein